MVILLSGVAGPKKKPPNRTGKIRSVLFRPEQDERLEWLLAEVGLSRNSLFRLVAEAMTPEDVANLEARCEGT